MRRRTTAVALSLFLALGALTSFPAHADEVAPPAEDPSPTLIESDDEAEAALDTADRILDGDAEPTDPSATIALRDLRVALPRLSGEERDQAESILARPTDGFADLYGNGYSRPSTSECRENTCVHWISNSRNYQDRDEVANLTYRKAVQTVVENDFVAMTETMGYRRPPSDGYLGGNDKFDVYLADLDFGLYGYCAPEQNGDISYSFCVLDNDYAESEFAAQTPVDNMRVTAAHELFHAVQFAYDSWEDYWLMEATATWMEERLADDVDDNRAFLRSGQLGAPNKSLDLFELGGSAHYGNWAFFEFVSESFGENSVRNIWIKAGAYPGAGGMYSTRAVAKYLSTRGGFRANYARFIAQNSLPELSYPEGSAYDAQPLALNRTLSPNRSALPKTSWKPKHLSSRTVRLQPSATMTGPWRLRIKVDLPDTTTGSEAVVLVRRRDGSSFVRRIALDTSGSGSASIAFDDAKIAWANVSLVNASTRFRCWRGTYLSCQGTSKDDGRTYTVWANANRV